MAMAMTIGRHERPVEQGHGNTPRPGMATAITIGLFGGSAVNVDLGMVLE